MEPNSDIYGIAEAAKYISGAAVLICLMIFMLLMSGVEFYHRTETKPYKGKKDE